MSICGLRRSALHFVILARERLPPASGWMLFHLRTALNNNVPMRASQFQIVSPLQQWTKRPVAIHPQENRNGRRKTANIEDPALRCGRRNWTIAQHKHPMP